MSKTPLYAIILSVVALFSIYFFTDIKTDTKDEVVVLEISDKASPILLQEFNKTLSVEEQAWINAVTSNPNESTDSQIAIDSLIAFYEMQEQYNFAAYFHQLKASANPTSKNWELAGDRQLSVSDNAAYDVDFNLILFNNAMEAYQNALNIDSENKEVKVKLGSLLVESSPQPMQGVGLILEVIEADSMHINANMALGKFGIISAQYDKAVIRLEKVLSLQPKNTEALFLAAEGYANLGETEKAIVCLEKCKEFVSNEELKLEIDAYLQQLTLK